MGDEEQPNKTELSNPQKGVENFLALTWYHPLVTPETTKLRNDSPGLVAQYQQKYGIPPEGSFFVPYGSIIGFAREGSDLDLAAFFTDNLKPVFDREESASMRVAEKVQVAQRYSQTRTADFVNHIDYPESAQQILKLLITPDDLILGDHEFLRQTRLALLNSIQKKIDEQDGYLEELNTNLNRWYKKKWAGWPDFSRDFPESEAVKQRRLRYDFAASKYAQSRSARGKYVSTDPHRRVVFEIRAMDVIDRSRMELAVPDVRELMAYIWQNEGAIPFSGSKK